MCVVFHDYFRSQLYSNASPLHFDCAVCNDRIYTLDSMCHIYIQRGVGTCHGIGVVRSSQGTTLGAKLRAESVTEKAVHTNFTSKLTSVGTIK